MKRALTMLASVLFVARPGAQAAVVTRNTALRTGPSRSWPIKENLQPGEELLVVNAAQTNGYYDVRAADGEGGWVLARNARIREIIQCHEDRDASLVAYVVDVRNGTYAALQGHWVRLSGQPLWDIEYANGARRLPETHEQSHRLDPRFGLQLRLEPVTS